jgi:hypothetical protein
MAIIGETRDDVPMQMGHHVAQAGQIDFVRIQALPQSGFHLEHCDHQALSACRRQVRHFLDMGVQYHPAKPRIVRIANQNDAAKIVLPEDVLACVTAQRAVSHSRTFSIPPR